MGRRQRGSDWAELAEAWKGSGETQRAFAERRGVPLSTLQSWIYRRRRTRSSRLIEVRVAAPAREVGPAEVALPNGLAVRISVGTEPAWASALIKSLLV
jgi:hypothetical protein